MEHIDSLFVINQESAPELIKTLCDSNGFQSVLFLATHRLFQSETDVYSLIANHVKIICFSDLLSDSEMFECDEIATRNSAHGHVAEFMASSLQEKNRRVHENLSGIYKFDKMYFSNGLGISESYWNNVGAQPMYESVSENKVGFVRNIINQVAPRRHISSAIIRLVKPIEPSIYVISENGRDYVFLSSIHRLRIHPDSLSASSKLPGFLAQKTLLVSLSRLPIAGKNFPQNPVFCMTIHDYNSALAMDLGSVLIFVDGYHPSNYPRSYIDSYGENDIFVVRTMFDEKWFKSHGKKTIKPPEFLQREYFNHCKASDVKNVLVALNHAGDWTALINRSDTDDLVIALIKVAQMAPSMTLRIRVHPTMDHIQHEGAHSSDRIRRLIRHANLQNLHVSDQSLTEDLTWCDACISEYSQVLLDSLRMGKMGIGVNLTRRRSFMKDYGDLGFYHVDNIESLIGILRFMKQNPVDAANKQNEVVNLYNALLADWLEERTSFGKITDEPRGIRK